MSETDTKKGGGIASQLPLDRLKQEARGFGEALAHRGLGSVSDRVEGLTGKLNDYAQGGGGTAGKMAKEVAGGSSPVKAGVKAKASQAKDKVVDAAKNLTGKGGGGGGKKLKVTNILESVDVPVSREVAYEQWTQFEDFPDFTKKVENVDQEEDEKVTWKAQIFWSHRSWTAKIVDQVPNERIVWKSDGEKGHVDGAITFHELAPDLTRILMVLEYHPKGLFEHTGNIWRAQGRRARLELKHFARHVSTQTILHQDELDGWKGEIHDGKVTDDGQGKSQDKAAGKSQDDSPEKKGGQAKERSSRSKSASRSSSSNGSSKSSSSRKPRDKAGAGSRSSGK